MKWSTLMMLFAVCAMLAAVPAQAQDCNHWWDARVCGAGQVLYDGPVFYRLDIEQAPISIAAASGWSTGWVVADNDIFAWVDAQGTVFEGRWDAETGCYLDWMQEDRTPATAFCYDGSGAVTLWYGTVVWTGHMNELQGPWLYSVYMFAPPAKVNDDQPLTRERDRAQIDTRRSPG